MATRTILFRGQTRRKGERTSISGIPLPGIWVAGGVFPQNKGYDYAIIYQQNPKVEKYVVHADTIGQYTGINDSLGNFIFEHEVTKMVRFYTPNLDEACDALNLYDIDYDLDDGDRIMVDDSFYDDVLDAFEEYDIEYEEV